MRGILILGWLLVPAAVAAYHYGPGQQRMAADGADANVQAARRHVAAGELTAGAKRLELALSAWPAERAADAQRIRLELGKLRMQIGQLPQAHDELIQLVDDLAADDNAAPELLAEARRAQASAHYYVTWLMRLEGLARDEWEPEIEASRQNYRLLAEAAEKRGDAAAARELKHDLEAAIRLARMEPGELQALPLPSQCKGCKSGNCKKSGKCKKPGNGEKKSESDARGAGSGPPPDGRGA